MTEALPDAAYSEDTLLGGRVKLRQKRHGYRVAIDPVLLAAAVPAAAGDNVLDIGCGAGAAALCLATRVQGSRVTGIEVQRDRPAAAKSRSACEPRRRIERRPAAAAAATGAWQLCACYGEPAFP